MPRREFLTTSKANALDLEGARLFTTTPIRTGPGVGEQIDGGVEVTDLVRSWEPTVLRTHLRRGALRIERDAPATDEQREQLLDVQREPEGDTETGPEEGDASLHAILGADDGPADPPGSDALPDPPEPSQPARAAPSEPHKPGKGKRK